MVSRMTRFERLLEAVPDALVGMDQEGVIRFVNSQTESLFGYDRDELIGEPIETLVPESLFQIYTEHQGDYFADLRTRSSGLDLVLTGRHRDGTGFPVNISLSHIDTGDVLLVVTAVRDVSSQRRAVQLAQLTAAVVEYSDDAIVGSTLVGMITSWNPAAERMFGYSAEEIIGKYAGLLIPGDRADELSGNLARIRADQPFERLETMRVRKDGTVFPVSITVAPIRDEDGVIVGASSVCRDMTELEHAAQYARSLIEASLDPLATISPEGRITDVNEATIEVTGVAREALVGSEYSQYLTEPDRATAFFQQVFAQGSVNDFPLTVRHRDGTLTDILCNASLYRDIGGNVIGVLAAARDVTSQKQAFEAVERMAAIVEYSHDAIIGETLDGIVTSWNPAAMRLYGYSSEQIIGQSVDLLIPGDRPDEMRTILARIKEGQPVEYLKTTRVRKDGTVFPVLLTVSPIRDAGGAIVGASAIARDVTEQN